MSDKEVSYNDDLQTWEPCAECLEIALDAAYCDGFDEEDDSFILLEDWEEGGDATDIYINLEDDDEV